mgnify:CR=1 FL=1
MHKIAAACQAFAKAMIEAGVDVVFVTGDYAGGHAPFIDVKLLRECELPESWKQRIGMVSLY